MTQFQQPVNYTVQNLRALRHRSEMSRRELIEELKNRGIDMHQNSLRRIEDGDQPMRIHEVQAFAEIFNMSLEEFITKPVNRDTAQIERSTKLFRDELASLEEQTRVVEAMWGHLGRELRRTETPPEQSSAVAQAQDLFESAYPLVKSLYSTRRILRDLGMQIEPDLLEGDPMDKAFTRPPKSTDGEG